MSNAVYLQSGGPTSVINASFYGVIKGCKDNNIKLYGSKYGIEGLINDDLVLIDNDLEYYSEIKELPGAILGTCRKCLSNEDEIIIILDTLNKYDIKYVFVNGGNDSMDTCNKLNKYFINNNIDKIAVGIPKTIDNDLALTDHCPGFGSNVKYVCRTVMEVAMDIKSFKSGRVTIIEIMGRDTGWLAASSICAKRFNLAPDLIYVPETPFNKDEFIKDVVDVEKKKGHVLICISEALKDKDGNYVSIDSKKDSFGHVQLGSVSKELANLISDNTNLKARAIELNLPQRCASHYQSKIDKEEAIQVGSDAVKYALNNRSGMVGIVRESNNPYKYHTDIFDLDSIANVVKYLPNKYVLKNNIDESYIDYCLPFIDEEEIKIVNPNMFIK